MDFIENITPYNCGLMNIICLFCNAHHFLDEKLAKSSHHNPIFSSCCNKGDLRNLPIPAIGNNEILQILNDRSQIGISFRQHIRAINSSFSMTSFRANYDHQLCRGAGTYTFRVNGTVYHMIKNVNPNTLNPTFAEVYFYDGAMQYQTRSNFLHLDAPYLASIQSSLLRDNPFIQSIDRLHQEDNILLKFRRTVPNDRRFDPPTVDEVAVILPGDGSQIRPREITLCVNEDSHPKRINEFHASYDPLSYVLIFPKGDFGWSSGLKSSSAANVTIMDFYKNQLHVRPANSELFKYGRLFHQYIVDMYAKMESFRLLFIRKNQEKLRAALYNIPEAVILPPTFTGGPRYMLSAYRDAITIVRSIGKPDLFLTITCNPNWPEITNNLLNNQPVWERPDLIVRVFNLKLKELKKTIEDQKIFGPTNGWVHSIEFQKRGLPHAHILIWLQRKPTSVESINQLISAELPSTEFPRLRRTVLKFMVHGPCNQNMQCHLNRNECKYHYPKPFQPETSISANGFPIYRRRFTEDHFPINNRWIVPYNPYLLMRFQCHINVEICTSIIAVKYLFKYLFKGSDSALVELDSNEITRYITGRYVSATESLWRIFSYPIIHHYPHVQHLQIHSHHDVRPTTLTAWFLLNTTDPEARNITYVDIPNYYAYSNSTKRWTKRHGNTFSLGRIDLINPNNDLYFLRIILHHIPGFQSFPDILTVRNIQFASFQQAALAHGLCQDLQEYRYALREASDFLLPSSLRALFTMILVHINPPRPEQLWTEFAQQLSEDSNDQHFALRDIHVRLQNHGSSLRNFPSMPQLANTPHNDVISNERSNYDLNYINLVLQQNITRLNQDQQTLFNEIMTMESSPAEKKQFFLHGDGGVGKTFLYNVILSAIRYQPGKIAIAVCSTAKGAELLELGTTAHSRFKIPLQCDIHSQLSLSTNDNLKRLIPATNLIIWDEAPSMHKYAIHAVERTFREIMRNDLLFGGKLIIFGGDFKQTLPVVKDGTYGDCINASLHTSYIWPQLLQRRLSRNMRISNSSNEIFLTFLKQLGTGSLQLLDSATIDIPPYIRTTQFRADAISFVYPDLHNPDTWNECCILTTTNEKMRQINDEIATLIPGDFRTYYSSDSAINNSEPSVLTEDYLNSLQPQGLPAHELHLKIHMPIMLIRNLDPKNGLCNGTILRILQMRPNTIVARIISGKFKGNVHFIPRITLQNDEHLSCTIQRHQFPINIAFAMTINKSQGQTLKKVCLYLDDTDVFAHGQLYVALTRTKSPEHIIVQTTNPRIIRNIVYKSIFYNNNML